MNKQVVINNLLINYLEYKQSDVPERNIIFLHGWRSESLVWGIVIKELRVPMVNCYALDLPGFGKSQVPPNHFTLRDYADVVAGFIKKLELQQVILVGHSFGGRTSIKLASEYPDLVKKLTLVDSAGFAASGSKKNIYGIAAKIAKPFFKPKFMQGLRRSIYKGIGSEDYLETPELREVYMHVINEDLTDDLKKITVPTLLVWGSEDKDTPVSYGIEMNKLIRGSELKVLECAGHFSFLDKLDEFVQYLVNFIKN